MQVNRYSKVLEAPIMNTYVPINFGELYRIGAALKQAIDEAAQLFGALLLKFGEFRSPSSIDTLKWYDLTINRKDMQNAILNMVANPDYLKDAANRSYLQLLINSVDYSSLSLLKESSNNLRAGLEMRAKMEAEGRYKRSWDSTNISNYDTLGSNKVFDQITPIRYMTADELSNPYFSNLKPSSIGSVYKDGVKYNRTGITYDTLLGIADARFNDLVSTPQGQQYYKEALAANNGDANAARQAFVGMIADSQRDRIVNQDTIDPYWLATAKQRTNNEEIIKPKPTRIDFLNTSIVRTVEDRIGNRLPLYLNTLDSQSINGNARVATKAKINALDIKNNQLRYTDAVNKADEYAQKYQDTHNEEDRINAIVYGNKADYYKASIESATFRPIVDEEFKRVTGYYPVEVGDTKKYNPKSYRAGVKAALNIIKADAGLGKEDDLITGVGGYATEISDTNGTKRMGYQFDSSEGFLFPETVLNMVSGNELGRTVKRSAGLFRDDDFPFKELVESGAIGTVQFIPDNKMLKTGPGDIALSGKLRIPKENIENALGTGMWGSTLGAVTTMFTPLGRASTKLTLKNQYGASEVEETVGKNGIEYYEIDIYRALPNQYTAPEYYLRVNQKWQNSPSHGGIGGAAQAQEEYYTSAEQLLGDNYNEEESIRYNANR